MIHGSWPQQLTTFRPHGLLLTSSCQTCLRLYHIHHVDRLCVVCAKMIFLVVLRFDVPTMRFLCTYKNVHNIILQCLYFFKLSKLSCCDILSENLRFIFWLLHFDILLLPALLLWRCVVVACCSFCFSLFCTSKHEYLRCILTIIIPIAYHGIICNP